MDVSRRADRQEGLVLEDTRGLSLEAELASWGKIALLEVRGRRSGRPLRTAIGFVEEPDGSILVAAGAPDADWALNLLETGTAMVTIAERTAAYAAEELAGPEREGAIARLILRYGTPAEGLGRGPAFRLRPAAAGAPATE